jgi:hypothetical protein
MHQAAGSPAGCVCVRSGALLAGYGLEQLAAQEALAVRAGVRPVLSVESVDARAAVEGVFACTAAELVVAGFRGVPGKADGVVAVAAVQVGVTARRYAAGLMFWPGRKTFSGS